MPVGAFDNILINGEFLRELWGRSAQPQSQARCEVWRQTFLADRWKVRYARPSGEALSQRMSSRVPEESASDCSLQLCGAVGVSEDIYLGQRVEARAARRYGRVLRFSARFFLAAEDYCQCPVKLVLGGAREPDVFGGAFNDNVDELARIELGSLTANHWTYLEAEVDLKNAGPHGLSVEMEFPAAALSHPNNSIRVADVNLVRADAGCAVSSRPAALESFLARRYFQPHSGRLINFLGRVFALNRHELFFQFTFPEMRTLPSCSLPLGDELLRVFNRNGLPQYGFTYDVSCRAAGSVIIRATKENHAVEDGYLAFTGVDGWILLDAEL